MGNTSIRLILNELHIEEINIMLRNKDIELLKIERPKYEVVEEKKELLTEEEREFLRVYMKLIGFEKDIEYIQKEDYHTLFLYLSDNSHFGIEITVENFVNIENYQKYTLSELNIELLEE